MCYSPVMRFPSDIGDSLVRSRRSLGMTQRELGERVGVRQPQIARWEASAYRTATLERVDAVARALEPGAPSAAAPAEMAAAGQARPVRDLGEIVARLRERGPELFDRFSVRRVGVFGSFLTGEQTPDSDVDLLVDFETLTWAGFMEAARFCEEILGRKVDFIRPGALRDRLRERVLGEVLYVWEAR